MDEHTQKKLDELNKPQDNIPEGVEMYEPEPEGIRNVNRRDEKQQFTSQDIGFSSKDEKPKQEKYNGPVTQTSYQNNDFAQSYNSANTTVHKSKANFYKKILLLVLFLSLASAAAYYFLG